MTISNDQRPPQADMQRGGVAEQSRLVDQPLRPGTIGAPEHGPQHLLDYQDSGVAQRHFHLDREGDQRGKAQDHVRRTRHSRHRTLYRHVTPDGAIRPNGEKLLARRAR